jgi:hypothetical protein
LGKQKRRDHLRAEEVVPGFLFLSFWFHFIFSQPKAEEKSSAPSASIAVQSVPLCHGISVVNSIRASRSRFHFSFSTGEEKSFVPSASIAVQPISLRLGVSVVNSFRFSLTRNPK